MPEAVPVSPRRGRAHTCGCVSSGDVTIVVWLVIGTAPARQVSKDGTGPAAGLRTTLPPAATVGVRERQAGLGTGPELRAPRGRGRALTPGAEPRFPASSVSVSQTCLTLTRRPAPPGQDALPCWGQPGPGGVDSTLSMPALPAPSGRGVSDMTPGCGGSGHAVPWHLGPGLGSGIRPGSAGYDVVSVTSVLTAATGDGKGAAP